MCRADVEAEFIVGHSRQGAKRTMHVILQVAQKEMCPHVLLKHDRLTTDVTGQHGCRYRDSHLNFLHINRTVAEEKGIQKCQGLKVVIKCFFSLCFMTMSYTRPLWTSNWFILSRNKKAAEALEHWVWVQSLQLSVCSQLGIISSIEEYEKLSGVYVLASGACYCVSLGL